VSQPTQGDEAAATPLHRDAAWIRSVNITPLRCVVLPATLDASNRILRQYEDHAHRLLRVNFTAESFASVYHVARSEEFVTRRIREHIKSTGGVHIAGRTFHFLAYSSSQLRSHSCWLYDSAPDENDLNPPSADDIRARIGDLSSIKSVGK
jgi:hypothetical protein